MFVLSQCNADISWEIAIAIIELYGDGIRLHATTDDYDNVKKIGDRCLLKYLNQQLFVHKVDLGSETSVDDFCKDIFKMELSVDAVVLHMDEMCMKSLEDTGSHLVSSLFDSNLFAPMLLIKTLLPALKAQRKGKIVCLTTIGGAIGIPLNSVYCAAKFALEGLLESLASECMQHSVTISILQTSLDNGQNPSKFVVELPQNGGICSNSDMEDKIKTQDDTVKLLERKGLLKDLNAVKISRTIKAIVDANEPYFRYVLCKRCSSVLKEKFKDLHGSLTVKEVSKFFLNADVD